MFRRSTPQASNHGVINGNVARKNAKPKSFHFLHVLLSFILGIFVSLSFSLFLGGHGGGKGDGPVIMVGPPPSRRDMEETGTKVVHYQSNGRRGTDYGGTSPKLEDKTQTQHYKVDDDDDDDGVELLRGLTVLVAVASFDFSQVPHLEEVLDSYRDLCEAGASVDVVIYTTVPYPVPYIDLLNSRLECSRRRRDFTVTISIHSPKLRLHLVDLHRPLFYRNLDAVRNGNGNGDGTATDDNDVPLLPPRQRPRPYDLFIYSEDDIRVRPTTVAAYLKETRSITTVLGPKGASDYNVGVVRYEYNFPPETIIDDKTRHATQNVTRVYWEHLWKPLWPKSVSSVASIGTTSYVTMENHHQGMFLATADLLRAWRTRSPTCRFDEVRDRPGMKNRPSQPTEGTQRVWMSSHMLHGDRHCGVRQLLPARNFGDLTVHHLPNKNYRRVGKKGRLGGNKEDAPDNSFGDGSEIFPQSDASLPTALELHLEIRRHTTTVSAPVYNAPVYDGPVRMVDETEPGPQNPNHRDMVARRMLQYHAYVDRGGILSDDDFARAKEWP